MKDISIIPLFVVIPLFTAFFISFIGRWVSKRAVQAIAVLSSLSLLSISIVAVFMLHGSQAKIFVYRIGGWIPPFGICMVLDGLSSLVLFLINLIAFFVTVYSVGYLEKYTAKSKYFTLFFLMLAGMNGLASTGDLFNLFIFLELASVAAYALVAFGTEAEELEAAFKYAIMGSIGSGFIFLAIAFLYSFTSTLNMADMAMVLNVKHSVWVVPFVSVLLFMGFGLKSALIPFHAWLPDAHSSAPAPVSAMLSGVLIKTLGVYAMVRVFFNIIGISSAYLSILAFSGALSIIAAVILAFSQWNLKRLLAYHSISQIGYIFLGIGLGTPLGIFGGLFHLFNHSIFKSLLFLNSGAIDYSAKTLDLREMSGLKKRMPVTAGTSLIASMSIAGIPPFNGFFSKLIIIFACVQKGLMGYALVAVIGSILTLASFMKVQKFAFQGEIKEKFAKIKEVPFTMKFSMVCLAVFCVLAVALLLPSFRFILNDAADVLLAGTDYAKAVLEVATR